jgi:hypothetical protein
MAPRDASDHGIGYAVKQLQNGSRVRRRGWNGKGMWLALGSYWSNDAWALGPHGMKTQPFVVMKTADNTLVPWLCSQTDLLATDWEIETFAD